MKNFEIVRNINNLTEFKNRNKDTKIPIKISFTINRNLKTLVKEYTVYKETLEELEAEYKCSASSISDDTPQEFVSKLNELCNTDVDAEIDKINESDFGEYDITPYDLDLLSSIINY